MEDGETKFLDALSTWQGPIRFGEEIKSRRLLIPQFYRDEMAAYCVSCRQPSDLETYWAECAKERIFNGGGSPDFRRFDSDKPRYRSTYLDSIVAARNRIRASQFPQLHLCLLHWAQDINLRKKDIGVLLQQKLEAKKIEECRHHQISADGWTGKKKDMRVIFQKYAKKRGFLERKLEDRVFLPDNGKVLCKQTLSGLMFYCWADTGGRPGIFSYLPVSFGIMHVDCEYRNLSVGALYPGTECYLHFKSVETAVLGLFALVEIFDALFSTFS